MKKILIFTLLISVSFAVFAQRKNYRTIDVFNNTVEFSVSPININALHLWQAKPWHNLSKEITSFASGGVSIGYHFSPILGTRVVIQGGKTNSNLPTRYDPITQEHLCQYDEILSNSYISTNIDLLVSLPNFWKTKAKRKYFDAQIVFGVGALSFRPKNGQDQFTGFAMDGGFILSYFLCKNFLINAEVKLFLTNDAFPLDYHYHYGGWAMLYDASLGFSYRIPTDQKNKRYSGRR